MKTIEISAADRPLSEYAAELDDGIIVFTDKKKAVAALVSLKNVDRECLSLSTNPEFIEVIEEARKEFQAGRKLSLDEIKREVSMA